MINKNKKIFLKKEKGITLIALIVTIIVLLIVAGISISYIRGDNGIINKTQSSKEVYEIGQYRDMLETAKQTAEIKEIKDDNADYFNIIYESLNKENGIKEIDDSNPNEEIILTEEGYKFRVNYDVINLIETNELKFFINSQGISIKKIGTENIDGIQYKINNGNWIDYNGEQFSTIEGQNLIKINGGDTIYAKLKNSGIILDYSIEKENTEECRLSLYYSSNNQEKLIKEYTGSMGEKLSITIPKDEEYTITIHNDIYDLNNITYEHCRTKLKGIKSFSNLEETKIPYTYRYTFNSNSDRKNLIYESTEYITPKINGITGYTGDGWALEENGEKVYNTEEKINVEKDLELYPKLKPITYTIKYDANAKDVTGTTNSSNHTYDVSESLTKNGFSKTGYTFIGWNTKADGKRNKLFR